MFAGKKATISKFNTNGLNAMVMEFEENRGQGNVISLFILRSRGTFTNS